LKILWCIVVSVPVGWLVKGMRDLGHLICCALVILIVIVNLNVKRETRCVLLCCEMRRCLLVT
jgi:hypothetical protein